VRIGGHVEAGNAGGAGARQQQRGKDADRGGLARAVRSEEAEHLAGRHVERDPVERSRLATVDLDQVANLDDLVPVSHFWLRYFTF
jgi:hypothetical protein